MQYANFPLRMTLLLGLLTALLFLGGCGGGDSIELAPVSGKVTMDGEPLANVTVTFQPITKGTENPGPGSFGKTDEQGQFTLELTTTGKSGAVVGKHQISITTPEPEGGEDSDVSDFVDPIPARYNARSTLKRDVSSDGTDEADFKLTSGKDGLENMDGDDNGGA